MSGEKLIKMNNEDFLTHQHQEILILLNAVTGALQVELCFIRLRAPPSHAITSFILILKKKKMNFLMFLKAIVLLTIAIFDS